jgi:translin
VSISTYVKAIDEVLKIKDEVRELVIRATRDIVRESGLVITYVHTGRLDEAEELLRKLKLKIDELDSKLSLHPELKYSNLYLTALSEYVEALQFLNIVKFRCLKSPEEVGVHYIPYLQGILDLIGEIKRYILNLIRLNNISEAWVYFNIANEIYEGVRGLDYPDALIPGIRHKVDVARKLLEDLREFLIDMESRIKLIEFLRSS